MNKQSVILTKHIYSTHLLKLLYYSLCFLDKEILIQIDSMIANFDVGTKWTLTLEEVEQ